METYILSGLPGSGKSTWSKKKVQEVDGIIISNDYFRTMLTGTYLFSDKYEPFIYESSWMILSKALQCGFNTIYDEINITKENRKKVIELVRGIAPDCKIICVWFKETEKNLQRRMQDSRGVPEHRWSAIIQEMKDKFEVPSIEEGFDEMIVI